MTYGEEQPRIEMHKLGASVWVVSACGEHDLSTVSQFGAALTELAQTPRRTTLILDLSKATFIDSSVIRETIRHAQGRPQHGADWLVVVSPTDTQPRRALDLIDRPHIVQRFENRADAVRFAQARQMADRLVIGQRDAATELITAEHP